MCYIKIVQEKTERYEAVWRMNEITYIWTDGSNKDFEEFYRITEEYYSQLVGGVQNREGFVPYNIIMDVKNVLIAYKNSIAVGCASFKEYSKTDAEIKRVWVQPEYRGKHLATKMMGRIEQQAKAKGYKRTVLQTREIMTEAVILYKKLGYSRIDNYPPYDTLDGAVCFAKRL